MTETLDQWITQLSTALEVDVAAVPGDLLLDLARDAAHGVARPAAPITTFLVGLAAGLRGGSLSDVQAAATIARRLTGGGEAVAKGVVS